MSCGCGTGNCGCLFIEGQYIQIAEGPSGTFTIAATPPIVTASDTDCIDLEVDEDGDLTARQLLSSDVESVGLECTEDGLAAYLLIDPDSTAIVTQSLEGLRVDVPSLPPDVDSTPVGTLIFSESIRPKAGYLEADGSEVPRVTYQSLWDDLSLFAEAATRTLGSAVITGIPATRFIRAGLPAEVSGFPTGMTVVSVDSATQITVSDVAIDSGSDTIVRVYPNGAGDGAFSFNVPDASRRFPLGYDVLNGGENIGTLGGAEDVTLVANNLPAHLHALGGSVTAALASAAISGTGTIATADDHYHGAGTGSPDLFVTVDKSDDTNATITESSGTLGDSFSFPVNPGAAPPDYEQGTREFTSTAGAKSVAASTIAAALSVSTAVTVTNTLAVDYNSTTNTPVDIMPPYIVGRWLIKT